MKEPHTNPTTVLHSGADYLDGIIADLERQAATMEIEAQQTRFPEVREGYERFVEVLRHCSQTLQEKSRELRK